MNAANNAGEAEFPFSRAIVFKALLEAIRKIEGMSIHSADELGGRVVVKTGMSLVSWGENVPISLIEPSANRTQVHIASTAKTGATTSGFFGGDGLFTSVDPTFGKHRKNIDRILAALSAELAKVPAAEEPKKKKCPLCAEMIQAEAIKCRFCGSDLRAAPEPTPEAQREEVKEAVVETAPNCDETTNGAKRVGDEVHFACTTCEQPIATDLEAGGMEVRCPECGEHLVVPVIQ